MMNLKEKAKNLPSVPGVYLMKDSDGRIIYVGKSKHLKNRVQSYFQHSKNHTKKVEKLVKNINDFDYIVTDTEFEAFMLECKLIQELQPMYNTMMKRPQSYTYIVIKLNQAISSIETTNLMDDNDGNHYFGPYPNKNRVEKAIQGLKEFLKIDCQSPAAKNAPCLNYSIGLCIGMCLGKSHVTKQYHTIITNIIALLNGTDKMILQEMKKQMLEAAENVDFEKAAKYRDDIEAITSLLKKEKVIKFTKKNKNIVMIEYLPEHSMKLFLIKGNKVLFSEKYQLENIEQLKKQIKTIILTFFKRNTRQPSLKISKNEIDDAQIIYSYLKSSNCNYIVIPNTWLHPKKHDQIDLAIHTLLSSEK